MKKIAIDLRAIAGQPAGKGLYAYNLVKNLLEIDNQHSYLLFLSEPHQELKESNNTQIYILKKPGPLKHYEISKQSQKWGADIFFSPTSYISPLFIKKDIKIIFTVHDLISFLYPKNHNIKAKILEKLTLKYAVKKAHQILSVSESTANDLSKYYPEAKSKTNVIYCAAAKNFKPLPDTQKENFILAVGTIQPRKNYLNLIRALPLIKNSDLKLKIIGKEGWQYQEVYAEIAKHNLHDRIEILGYIDLQEINLLYNKAQALVFPSFYEGFGIPPLEAMQAGCPVICSNTSSLPEVVGDSALLIDPSSPESIAQAINSLPQNALVEKGLHQAKKFSWRKSAEQLLAIFDQI